jgi:hypothetical protein
VVELAVSKKDFERRKKRRKRQTERNMVVVLSKKWEVTWRTH